MKKLNFKVLTVRASGLANVDSTADCPAFLKVHT